MQLCLYSSPFVIKDNVSTRADHLLDMMDEFDRSDELKLQSMCLKFLIAEKILVMKKDAPLINPGNDIQSWVWMVANTNMRSLADSTVRDQTIAALSQYGRPIDRLLNLHSRIGAMVPTRVLNTIITRTITSIGSIPYDDDDRTILAWDDIHKEIPFLWLLVYLQMVLYTETTEFLLD